jgi:putative copper export protein
MIRKGADFTAAMVFQFAATNLVLELGVLMWVLIAWQFAAAEFLGGPIMIVVLVLLFRFFATWFALAGVALAGSNGGHPVRAGLFSLPVWADWAHLLAISAWVGLVLVTTYVVVPRFFNAPDGEHVNSAAYVQSLSDTATLALVVLFVTGAYNGWRGVDFPGNLLESGYGQILLLKLALVLVAAALGGHNRFFEMPGLLASLKDASSTSPVKPLFYRRVAYRIGGTGRCTRRHCRARFQSTAWNLIVGTPDLMLSRSWMYQDRPGS